MADPVVSGGDAQPQPAATAAICELRALSGERPHVERSGRLLARVVLDLFVNLPLYSFKVEARWRLHGRVFDGRLRQFGDLLLNKHEAPKFAGKEVIHVTSGHVIQVLAADRWRPLEWVLADVDDHRH